MQFTKIADSLYQVTVTHNGQSESVIALDHEVFKVGYELSLQMKGVN